MANPNYDPQDKLSVQCYVLTDRISSNANMQFDNNALRNKGLNPEYFKGNMTKVVNALNKLAENTSQIKTTVEDVYTKFNPVILDTYKPENQPILEAMRKATGKDTLIESVLALRSEERR